jgi:eukaryotic-like serine/threonine-protein kinase
MNPARARIPLGPHPGIASTARRAAEPPASAVARPRAAASGQREFSDGEVIDGTRYRVLGLVGAGGMGSVYEVEHVELGKRFVLKALLRGLASREDLVYRLRTEWRALGRLEHPNIVSVSDAGVTAGNVPYYVMERLRGETLSARLRRERRILLPDALGIATDLLDGLSAAHRIGIVHRDVKPPNIFLVPEGAAKLLDFGIAKVLDPKAYQVTGHGIAIGTPRYMAPEQATGAAVDARTDLYSVGLVLFEMIAGRGPFDGARDANELFLAHLTREAPPLSEAAPGIPDELGAWMRDLLAKDPRARPVDAVSVSRALREIRAGIVQGRRGAISSARVSPARGDAETRTVSPEAPTVVDRGAEAPIVADRGAEVPTVAAGSPGPGAGRGLRAALAVAAGAGLLSLAAPHLPAGRTAAGPPTSAPGPSTARAVALPASSGAAQSGGAIGPRMPGAGAPVGGGQGGAEPRPEPAAGSENPRIRLDEARVLP